MNLNKYFSEITADRRNHNRCIVCGQNTFHINSHSVPRFSLNTLSNFTGKRTIHRIHTFHELNPYIMKDSTKRPHIRRAGVFKMVCPSCERSRIMNRYERESYRKFKVNDRDALFSLMIKTLLHNTYFTLQRIWAAKNVLNFFELSKRAYNHDSIIMHVDYEREMLSELNISLGHYCSVLDSALNKSSYKNNHQVVYYKKSWGISPLNAHAYIPKVEIAGQEIKNLYVAVFNKGEFTIEMLISKMGKSEEVLTDFLSDLSPSDVSRFLLELISVSPTMAFTDRFFIEELKQHEVLINHYINSKGGYRALYKAEINEVNKNLPVYTDEKYNRLREVLGMEDIRLIDRLDLNKIKQKMEKDPTGVTLQVLADEYGVSRQRMDQAFQELGFSYKEYKDQCFDEIYLPELRERIINMIERNNGKISNEKLTERLDVSHVMLFKAFSRKELQELKKKYRKMEEK